MKIRPKNIPKFQGGNNLKWYSGLRDYNPNDYVNSYNITKLVNGDINTSTLNPWKSNISGYDEGRYLPTTGYGNYGINGSHYSYTKGVENQDYYRKFGEDLLDSTGNFTPVGKAWAKAVDALLPAGSNASFYDPSGNIRTSWTTQYKDVHGRKARTFDNLRDYVNYIRNDLILGARHNVFLKIGKRYFYTDDEGNRHWVDPNVISNYQVSDNPVELGWEGTTYWNDYEITSGKNDPPLESTIIPPGGLIEVPTGGSVEVAGDDKKKKFDWSKINLGFSKMMPNLLEAGRLAGSLYTNSKIYDAKLKGIRPNLALSYLTHRQVVGDEATRQGYYRRAAEGLTRASRPFTADADRLMAYMMEARRVGDELRAQGDLADNAEIRRTSDESNQHQWANTQRRTEVANNNIAEINRANADRLAILALKYAADYSSWDNFLKGKEYRIRLKLAEDDAIQKQIWALQDLDSLINDETLLKLQKEAEEAWNNNSADKMEKILKYRNYLRQKQIEMLQNQRSRNTGIWWAANGMKITHKKKDDLLYKSTKDVVEHFRKISKMSEPKTPKNKVKLTPHPSSKTRRMQLGGVAPFTVFTPVALGGETSTLVSSTGTSASNSKSSDNGKETLDLIKSLFLKVEGLPIDVNSVYKSMSNFLAKSQAFGTELNTNDIASMYLQSMLQLSGIKHSKEVYDKAKAVATLNDALGEFAVTSNGRYVVQDQETGKLSIASLKDIQEKGLNPLTNEQLINLRAYSPDLAFGAGDNIMELVVNNGVGMSKIAETINKLKGTLGSTESTIEGYTKHESNQIKKGLELLTEAPAGDYKYTQYTKELQLLMLHAYNYILTMLPNNMKAVLRINAYNQGVTPDVIIKSLLSANSSSNSKLEFDAVTGKAAKDANGNSKEGNVGDMTPSMAFFMGMGDRNTFVILDKTRDGLKINTNSMSLLDSQGHNLGPSTLLGISLSMYGSQLDLNSATMGDVKISPNGLNNVLISDGMIHATELPIDRLAAALGIIKPDLSFLKNIEKADLQLRELGIKNRDNLTQEQINTINKVYRDNNLPIIYTTDGSGQPVLTSEYRRFAMLNGYATEDAFEGDMTFNDGALEVNEDKEVKQFEGMMLAVTKNNKYKLDRGWFSGTDLYKGVIYIPMVSSTITALGGTGYKGTAGEYMTIDKLQQQRDNAIKLGYLNPGGNASMLK